ncbi:unnamed protein product [Adineta steineri]|uniref:NHL repeat containing protein-like protein n=1 Tax=Adineta steineri TaxID=433720 RepID=A0A819JVT2_9BILA|nr:unnamed protein product [Adineta steineri]CAF3934075.1 unnamed protein product [Adineta steineri]
MYPNCDTDFDIRYNEQQIVSFLFISLLGIPGNLLWNTTGITILDSSQITSARGLYIDSNNTLYITDTGVVWKLLNNATNATIAVGISQLPGSNSTQLNSPQDVYVDRHGNMYVSDFSNHRIQKYINGSADGITIAGLSGTPGFELNLLNSPARFTFDSTDTYFYVNDYGNNRTMKYLTNSTTGNNGSLVAGGDVGNNSNTSLNGPGGIDYLPSISDTLFISNLLGHSVIRWIPGASSGFFVAGVPGVAGSNSTLLNQPRGIKLDKYLNMYVVDSGNHRVQFFCANNQTAITVAGTGIAGNSTTELNGPRGVEFDAEMNMYVTDSGNIRVQKFLKL